MTKIKSEESPSYLFNPEPAPRTAAISAHTATLVDAALAALAADLAIDKDVVSDPSAAAKYLRLKLSGREREIFAVMYVDCRHRLIGYQELHYGTVDGAEVHPRELVKSALACNASAVIVAHNHPSGDPEPSAADRAITARLKQSLSLVDVTLLDHFVVGHTTAVSLASRGWV